MLNYLINKSKTKSISELPPASFPVLTAFPLMGGWCLSIRFSLPAPIYTIGSLDGRNFLKQWEDTMGYELSIAYNRRVSKNEFKDYII